MVFFMIIPRKIKHDEIRYGDTQTVCLIFISEDNIKPEILKDRVLIANGQEQVSIYYDQGLLSPTVFSEDEVSTSGRVRTTYRLDFELMDLKKSFKLTFDFK